MLPFEVRGKEFDVCWLACSATVVYILVALPIVCVLPVIVCTVSGLSLAL